MLDLVVQARREAFVGRVQELAAFERYLARRGGLLYVHGPGGVGKTALLRQFAWLAERAGRAVVWHDARDTGHRTPPPDVLLADGPGTVLLVDAAECLPPLDRWINEKAVTTFVGDILVVLASREPPPRSFRLDPGWREVLCRLTLTNFDPIESARFLTDQGVPEAEQAEVIEFTRGHALALALVADARAQHGGQLPDPARPEVVTALLDVLLSAVPGPVHRAAIEASALVRVTTEPLLAALLDVPEAREVFDWLRGLSVIELGSRGIAPHDLVRQVLAAELRWRHPDRHRELRRRATAFYRERFDGLDPAGRHVTLVDGAFVHRDHPVVGRVLSALAANSATTDADRFTVLATRPADHADVRAMVARHEGDVSAGLADHWLRRQPQNSFVVVDNADHTVGYLQLVSLAQANDEDRRVDPGVAAATTCLALTLAPGQAGTLVRFWLGRETYQDFCPVQTAITLHIMEHFLTSPGLAVTLIACARPADWAVVAAHTLAVRVPAADFTVDGRTMGVFGHDWRVLAPLHWLAVAAELEAAPVLDESPAFAPATSLVGATATPTAGLVADSAGPVADPDPGSGAGGGSVAGSGARSGAGFVAGPIAQRDPTPIGLSAADFADAVKAALRDLNRVDRLGHSPLLASRLVAANRAGSGVTDRARALQQVIRSAAGQLAESPRDVDTLRVVHHTYLQPAGTQRRACDLLNLPTSTYRRRLTAGVDHLIAILWQQECDAGGQG